MTNQVWTPIRHVHVADQWVAAASRQDFVDAAHADADYADKHGRVRTRLIFDSNGQGISFARSNPEFRAATTTAMSFTPTASSSSTCRANTALSRSRSAHRPPS